MLGQRNSLELPTKLFNERFTVTVDMINDFCGIMERDGNRALPKLNSAERLECVKIVFKKEGVVEFPLDLVKVSNLDVPERLLHYVIAQFVFARKRASEITDLDLFCMAKIMRREPFNFGAFVIGKMLEACVRIRGEKGFHCPFGKIITLICERQFGESRLANMAKVEEIQRGSLEDNIKLMNFVKVNGSLVSLGFRELYNALREAFRGGGVGMKRKKGQRSIKNLSGVHYGSSSRIAYEEENEEEENDEEEDEEGANEEEAHDSGLSTNERITLMMEQIMVREARERKWREEDVAWRQGIDLRMDAFEENQAEMKATLRDINERLRRGDGGDGMEP